MLRHLVPQLVAADRVRFVPRDLAVDAQCAG
jgi:hypothetical protein